MIFDIILIIGGGIVGMVVVILLIECGFKVILIDKDLFWLVYGVGIICLLLMFCVLNYLGIGDVFVVKGVFYN